MITNSTRNPWIDYISLIIMTSVFVLQQVKEMTKFHGTILLFLYLSATLLAWNFNS